MDDKRFDDLSRAVASMASRRSVLKGLVGGAVASLIGAVGLGDAAAAGRKRGPGVVCRKQSECADGLTCAADGTDGRSRCTCPAGTYACRGQCISTGFCCSNGDCKPGDACCGGTCCDTYCSPDKICGDSDIDSGCYHDCVDFVCLNMNHSFNNSQSCRAYCANSCGIN